MSIIDLFKSKKEQANTQLPLLETLAVGAPMLTPGVTVNPAPLQKIERSLGRIYRLFMKLEDMNAALAQNRIDPEAASFLLEKNIRIFQDIFSKYSVIMMPYVFWEYFPNI